MNVLELAAVDPERRDLGGKAAGLAALIRMGERVPDGFCVTTEAHHRGEVPRADGRRRPGLGAAVVDGTTAADHYVLDGTDHPNAAALPRPG